jgi:glycine cleavage system H lipoate-binding protein
MKDQSKENRRSQVGYGTSYRKGSPRDLGTHAEIGTVLGGQVWMVRPDQKAETANPCLWMQAGVVEFKNCNNFYDCTSCKYDLGMKKKAGQGAQPSWQDAMRVNPGIQRTCRHSLTNRISNRHCAYDFQCAKCDFDQFFEDVWTNRTKTIPSAKERVKGFEVPMGYYFHNGHTWAKIESGGTIRVGMDDFALKLLGRADAYEMPLMGKELDHGKAGWGLKRSGNLADVLSPVNGVIVEVNSKLRENPGEANREPYSGGWMFVVYNRDIKDAAKQLMTDVQGLEWMNGEVAQLEGMIEEVAGPLAADGGFLGNDIYGNLPDLGWDRLTRTFLKSK